MAKRIIVLGVSTFSEFLLRQLGEMDGIETIAVDRDEERIDAVTPFVDQPIIGSARNHELLQKLEVASADHVIVSLGTLEDSLICVLYLKQLEARNLMVKALNEEHVQILEVLGITEIVFPERSMAELVAVQLLHPQTRDVMKLSSGHRIIEIAAPDRLVESEAQPASFRDEHELELIMVIDAAGTIVAHPPASYRVGAGDTLVLVGTDDAVERFEERVL